MTTYSKYKFQQSIFMNEHILENVPRKLVIGALGFE